MRRVRAQDQAVRGVSRRRRRRRAGGRRVAEDAGRVRRLPGADRADRHAGARGGRLPVRREPPGRRDQVHAPGAGPVHPSRGRGRRPVGRVRRVRRAGRARVPLRSRVRRVRHRARAVRVAGRLLSAHRVRRVPRAVVVVARLWRDAARR